MKTLFWNGKFYVSQGQFAEAVLVEDGVITDVGSHADVATKAGGAVSRDMCGKTVIPGFYDSHMHLVGVGNFLLSVSLMGSTGIDDIIKRAKKFIKDNKIPAGTVIVGRGWNQDYFADPKLPQKEDLDKISTEHPIIFRRACGHILVCNSKAIQLARITKDTVPLPGGEIDKRENGEPTGILRENALEQVECIVPSPTVAQTENAILRAMDYAVTQGITSIGTNDINDQNYKTINEAYCNLAASGRAKVRINMQSSFTGMELFEQYLSEGFHTGKGDNMYKIGPLKLFVDGSLGARTALMRNEYNDERGNCGMACLSQAQLDSFVMRATRNKMQVIAHAIGDRAIEMVIDAYEKYGGENNPLRHGIVHAQITDNALLARIHELNIIVLAQPIFLHYDMHVVESRVGTQLASSSYAFGTMKKNGTHISFGTDSPVEDLSTFDNLHCAINRMDLKNYPEGGYQPKERFELCDALDSYTEESAYYSFEENIKGRLSTGMVADFVVLERDIFEENVIDIRHTKVMETILGGKTVYKA